MARWNYLTIMDLVEREEPVWLFFKRWDGGVLIPTAIHHLNRDDEGNVYSIAFFSGNVQIVKGYGVYWWATTRKPDLKSLKKWGWKDENERTEIGIRSGIHEAEYNPEADTV